MQAVTTTMTTTSGDGTVVTQQGQQLPQYQFPGPISFVYAVQAPPSGGVGRVEKLYRNRQSMGIGLTLIITGVLSIILNGVAFRVNDTLSFVGHGFYCGVMLIITGSFGIAAAARNFKCLIITFMVLTIISATVTASMLIVAVIGACINPCQQYTYGYCPYGYDYGDYCSSYGYQPPCKVAAISIEATLAFLALVSAILCIWGSAICCRSVCCCSNSTPYNGAVMYMAQNNANQPFVVFNQQQMMGGSQFIPAVPPPYIGSVPLPYQPVVQPSMGQHWVVPPCNPQGQGCVMPTGNGNNMMPTAAGARIQPPEYCSEAAGTSIGSRRQTESVAK